MFALAPRLTRDCSPGPWTTLSVPSCTSTVAPAAAEAPHNRPATIAPDTDRATAPETRRHPIIGTPPKVARPPEQARRPAELRLARAAGQHAGSWTGLSAQRQQRP